MKVRECINGKITEREYTPSPEEIRQEKLSEIEKEKEYLNETDYMSLKCLEAKDRGENMPYDFEKLKRDRQASRDRINRLESELNE